MNKDKNMFNPAHINKLIYEIEERNREIEEFKDKEKYKEVLDEWEDIVSTKGLVSINDTQKDYWSDNTDLAFSLLTEVAQEVDYYIDFPVIKYENIYITLKEYNGQGSYRVVELDYIDRGNYIPFENVEKFIKTGARPEKYYVLKTVKKGLSAVKSINGDVLEYDNVKMNVHDIWEYVVNNLL